MRIQDIDPIYTLGDLEREKKTITKLKAEGNYFLNKGQKMALVPKRFAIISVGTSKGYQDFESVLQSAQESKVSLHRPFHHGQRVVLFL